MELVSPIPDLSDERWARLEGAYRQPYDVRPPLLRLAAGDTGAWDELWDELYHQGDAGEASYAAVPELVRLESRRENADWNTFALAASIEGARKHPTNPPLPDWLVEPYHVAWRNLEAQARRWLPEVTDPNLVSSLFAVLASAKGQPMLARMALLTEAERAEMLDEAGWG